MFDALLKVAEEVKQKNPQNDFAKFQKDFARFEKSNSPIDERAKKDKLFGRKYKPQ